MVLNVGGRRTEPAEGEDARLGHIAGGGTAPRHEELQGRDQRPKPAALAVERRAGPRPLQNVDVEMILQILADTGKRVPHGRAGGAQMGGGTGAGKKKNLRRVEGAGGN